MSEKITKKMLKGYLKAQQESKILQESVTNMLVGDNGMGNSVILDYRKGFPRPQSVVGFDSKKYEQKIELLKQKQALIEAVDRWIESLEDICIQTVFDMRYRQGAKWESIAEKLGYKSADYVRIVMHDRTLKEKNDKKEK